MTRLLGSRVALAVLRAGFMSLLVALPQLLLGHGTPGSRQLVALFALRVAVMLPRSATGGRKSLMLAG